MYLLKIVPSEAEAQTIPSRPVGKEGGGFSGILRARRHWPDLRRANLLYVSLYF